MEGRKEEKKDREREEEEGGKVRGKGWKKTDTLCLWEQKGYL